MKFCERCGAVHCKADSRAMGRFDPRGPRGYQPAYAGAPVLPTREEAELDMCRRQAALRSFDRGSQR